MAVTDSAINSKSVFTEEGSGVCSTPDCDRMAQTKCSKCELLHYFRHSKHPRARRRIAGTDHHAQDRRCPAMTSHRPHQFRRRGSVRTRHHARVHAGPSPGGRFPDQGALTRLPIRPDGVQTVTGDGTGLRQGSEAGPGGGTRPACPSQLRNRQFHRYRRSSQGPSSRVPPPVLHVVNGQGAPGLP